MVRVKKRRLHYMVRGGGIKNLTFVYTDITFKLDFESFRVYA